MKIAEDDVASCVLCRLLDRTPSERSEDKLVFLNQCPNGRSVRKNDRTAAAERMGIDDESDQVP